MLGLHRRDAKNLFTRVGHAVWKVNEYLYNQFSSVRFMWPALCQLYRAVSTDLSLLNTYRGGRIAKRCSCLHSVSKNYNLLTSLTAVVDGLCLKKKKNVRSHLCRTGWHPARHSTFSTGVLSGRGGGPPCITAWQWPSPVTLVLGLAEWQWDLGAYPCQSH